MDESDKNPTEIIHTTNGAASIAMALPEILASVFAFLDPPSLTTCLQVSRLWHACGEPILWRRCFITVSQFNSIFHPQDASDDRMQAFYRNSLSIRTMTVFEPRRPLDLDPPTFLSESPSPTSSTSSTRPSTHDDDDHPPIPTLQNLVHMVIRTFEPDPSLQGAKDATGIFRHAGILLSQCPGVRELEWDTNDFVTTSVLVKSVLRYGTKKLKRLSIAGSFKREEVRIFQHLIEAHSARQRHQQEQVKDISILDRMENIRSNSSPTGTHSDCDHRLDGCSDVEELVLRNRAPDSPILNLTMIRNVPGTLPIRSLTLVDFKTETYFFRILGVHQLQQENDSLLAILEKCPLLEKLCVTYDLSNIVADASLIGFRNAVTMERERHSSHVHRLMALREVKADFVDVMYRSCPKLRDIEFGMTRQFTDAHWNQMMRVYGFQLESVSIWGELRNYNTSAFMTLIGPPSSRDGDDDGLFHCLTRLNINGLEHLQDCAWMALRHLPQLKEFKARDVPLDARHLIMEDDWICKGLEVLEIYIAIPWRLQPLKRTWHWCDSHGEWTRETTSCQCDVYLVTSGGGGDDHSNSGDDNGHGNGRSAPEDTIHSTQGEKHENDQEQEQDESVTNEARQKEQGAMITGGQLKMSEKEKEKEKERKKEEVIKSMRRSGLYFKELQIRVCEMLGRLTQLRVLRIEGERTKEWDCLDLTLEAGLDRLAPLQQNLEKLVVTHLNDKLGGKDELEWIARHWVHHRDRRWLEQHAGPLSPQPLASEDKEGDGDGDGDGDGGANGVRSSTSCAGTDTDDVHPTPRFRELIGISVRGTHRTARETMANIEWLKEQCPALRVV
ncbi:hypothetical protein B0O80DRAFT_465428 [Mortierella sp. GBAus27b]|nr:hypothetical protein BGX31_000478 [Mortierella sp. GBA43]KAI8347569.1 hypothetical protein B0O80DRAFT_465428 [Mortierella sp. GBAus27b]